MADQLTVPDDLLQVAASIAPGDPALQEGIFDGGKGEVASIAETHPKYRAGEWSVGTALLGLRVGQSIT